jgi:predicted amidohydrolase
MHINILLAPFPVSFSVRHNLDTMLSVLDCARGADLVVFPEGSVSGYADDLSFLDGVDLEAVAGALERLQAEAMQRGVHIWAGACRREEGQWSNQGLGFAPGGERHVYRKINLATHERGRFAAGDALPVFDLAIGGETVRIGVQLCRELRFPEQWRYLARRGAQVILHLNNAIGGNFELPVWRSHLVSRAAENQRFVVSVNNAASVQKCPSLAVAPNGLVLGELVSGQLGLVRVGLDLGLVSDWYLGQSREDVVGGH